MNTTIKKFTYTLPNGNKETIDFSEFATKSELEELKKLIATLL